MQQVWTMRFSPLLSLFLCIFLFFLLHPSSFNGVADAYMTGPRTTNESLVGQNTIFSFPVVPTLFMTFKYADGSIVPGVNSTYTWISLDEIDNSTGTAVSGGTLKVVQSLNILDPSLVWNETVAYPTDSSGNVYKTLNYTTTFSNGVTLIMIYDYFPKPHFIDYPYLNASRTIPADSFKASIHVQGWKPVNLSNLFCMQLHTAASPYFGVIVPVNNGFFYTIHVDVGTDVHQTLNILSAGLIKTSVPAPVSYYSEFSGTPVVDPQIEIPGYKLYFFFPNFANTFFYDPDLSAIVDGSGNGNVYSGDGGSSSTTTILVAVLVPVLVVGALLIVAVVIIVAFLFFKRSMRSHILKRIDSLSSADSAAREQVPE